MIHLPTLISDLAIILVVAGAVTLLFKKIGQPVVLGYLLAGILVGPEVSFLPTVQEKDAIKVWAEIGVIVLLFGLGLEFSFKKLASVGRGASITAITEISSMFAAGFAIGKVFGWSTMDSVFLGGILSISSTTIIIRAFDELGLRQRKFVNLVFGVLIVEDLIAILLMVLLSTIAVSNTFEGAQLFKETGRLGFFLTLWFVGGIFLVPWFLRKTRHLMNSETSLIVSLGLCLLMVVIATKLGFSPALGAFIMGSIFAETSDGQKIEHNLKPVRDLFAAVFFVSIGMLIEIKPLQEHWLAVVVISAVTIVGKILSTSLGALLAGRSLRHSVQTGMSLAQIGEFSFIIATLGLSLKVTSDFLYPIAVAVSAITTFTTPYLIRHADRVYGFIEKFIPADLLSRLNQDVSEAPDTLTRAEDKSSNIRLLINGVIIIAITLATSKWIYPFLTAQLGDNGAPTYVSLAIAVLCCLPFLWGIASRPGQQKQSLYSVDELKTLTTKAVLSFIGRIFLSVALLGFIASQFTSAITTAALLASLAAFVGVFGYRNFARLYQWLESRFLSHLNEKELELLKNSKPKPTLAPWDAHLAEIKIHADSSVIGKTLSDLGLREKYGVIIALIERGKRQIMAPDRNTILMAQDEVFVIGTDEQIAQVTQLFGPSLEIQEENQISYGLGYLVLDEKSPFNGRPIRESGVREATEGLIVGLERGGERILNPDSMLTLTIGDRLWIVGNKALIRNL